MRMRKRVYVAFWPDGAPDLETVKATVEECWAARSSNDCPIYAAFLVVEAEQPEPE
jgi:hypothetical protein